jgi:hypothetical protein
MAVYQRVAKRICQQSCQCLINASRRIIERRHSKQAVSIQPARIQFGLARFRLSPSASAIVLTEVVYCEDVSVIAWHAWTLPRRSAVPNAIALVISKLITREVTKLIGVSVAHSISGSEVTAVA